MKIAPYDLLNNINSKKASKSVSTTGQNFDDILRNQLNSNPSHVSQTASPPPMQSISKTDFLLSDDRDKHQNIEHVERFLDTLETYQEQLSDPSASLKDLDMLVSQIEERFNTVMPILDSLPDGNTLKDIINRAAVTSTVEVIKFNRGDYL